MDHSRPAGTRTTSFGSTSDCLRFEAEQYTSPTTAEHRRLNTLASSIRSENRGSTEDYTAKNLQQLTFGRRTASGENTAASLMHQPILTTVEGLNLIKAEKVYRSQMREPLGRSTDRGVMLPYKFSHDNQAFGASSKIGQPAKELIFPGLENVPNGSDDIYKRSHGSFAPGEKMSRGYDWHGIDMDKKIFGMKGTSMASNRVSTNVAEALQDIKASDKDSRTSEITVAEYRNKNGDRIGQTRYLHQFDKNRTQDLAYGMPSGLAGIRGKPRETAKDIMNGDYNENNEKYRTQSARELSSRVDHVFGCPTVRWDLPAIPLNQRSLANSISYEDDVHARHLISPPQWSNFNLSPTAFEELKTKNEIQLLFSKIGYDFETDYFNALFKKASNGSEKCSINQFRDVMNNDNNFSSVN